MDGKNTSAVFVPQPAIKSMTEEEMNAMFDAHHRAVATMQRLSLHPRVMNIDRPRSEKHSGEEIKTRTTRDWANSMKTLEGKHMRCDAENGGSDRKAYLLVPSEHVESAKEELQKYLHALKVGLYTHNSPSGSSQSSNLDDTPRAIYIPSQAVRANLDFLKSFTSVDIWKNAPASVRQTPPGAAGHDYRPGPPRQPHRQQQRNEQEDSAVGPDTQQGGSEKQTPPKQTASTTDQHRSDDFTIGTLASTTSRTASFFSAQTNRFQELEAQIKLSQQAYAEANSKIDTIQEQVLKTMEACATSSQQINEMRHKLNECASANQVTNLSMQVQDLANALTALVQIQKMPTHTTDTHSPVNVITTVQPNCDSHTAENDDKLTYKRSINQVQNRNTLHPTEKGQIVTSTRSEEPLTTSTASQLDQTTAIPSPEKKRTKTQIPPQEAHDYAQEPSAQYTRECTPDDVDI
jgi:hypothetical protein